MADLTKEQMVEFITREVMKMLGMDEEEPEDDGFLEALDSSATDDWENDESLKEGAENEETTSNI